MKSIIKRIDGNVLHGTIFVDNLTAIEGLSTKINQDIQFVNTESWEVYEHYTVNNEKIQTKLGFFDKKFRYFPTTLQSFVERRGNFQGHHLKAITEEDLPFIKIDLSSANYDETNQVYDVTQKVGGMYYDLFLILKEQLNFTTSIHKRKDGKWGPITKLENGTILTAGIASSITSGFAEIVATRYTQFDRSNLNKKYPSIFFTSMYLLSKYFIILA